jgi:hypothetical protein
MLADNPHAATADSLGRRAVLGASEAAAGAVPQIHATLALAAAVLAVALEIRTTRAQFIQTFDPDRGK